MKLWKLVPLLLGSLVLGACTNMHHDQEQNQDANRASGIDLRPAYPYNQHGGFSDPGPNYPNTGH
jgi:hypothetical protein